MNFTIGDCTFRHKPWQEAQFFKGRQKFSYICKQPLKNLNALYDAWNKPEKAEEWRTKLEQNEDFEE